MGRLIRWLCLLAALLVSSSASAREPVRIDDHLDTRPVGRHLAFFWDETGQLALPEVLAAEADGRFVPSASETQSFGYRDAALWIRLPTDNVTAVTQRWLLDMRYELHDIVDLYEPDGAGGYRQRRAGDFVPHHRWPLSYRAVVFPVDQPPGSLVLYLRIRTTNPLNLPIRIHSPQAFAELQDHEAILLWLYYGLLLGLAVYNAFLFLFLRDRSYLYYVLYIVAAGGFVLSHNGLAFQYLWPSLPGWNNRAHVVFGLLASLAVVQFCRSFLNTPRTAPRVDRIFVALLLVAAGASLPSLFVYAPFVAKLGAVLLIGVMLLMLATGILLLRRGFAPARFYVLGWSALLAGVTASLLQALGVVPISFLTDWGYQIASAVEMLLFSVALADRINQMKRDVEELNVALEEQVVQRTRSLRSATLRLTDRTADLERINDKLSREVRERRKAERERKRMEDQLRQSQKMDAVGRLAGGVAHDMNNVLGVVMGYAELLQQELSPDDPRLEDAGEIVRAVERGKDLTGNLLAFARRGAYHKRELDLNAVVGKVRALLDRTVLRRIEIVSELCDDLPAVEGDDGQLTHAIMNLCLNGVQAMGDAGTLTLSTGVRRFGPGEVPPAPELAAGRYVYATVEDTGRGMAPEVLEQVLEPFFTTKPRGEGSGLGLSMAYGTVKNHGGGLSLESAPGEGTVATVWLPALDVAAPRRAAEEAAAAGRLAGLALVVDDEEMMRKSMARALSAAGMTVIEAAGGPAAVDRFEEHHRRIAVVVLDMMMPGMDGAQTFAELRRIDPTVPVLLASGFADQAAAQRLASSGAAGFVGKPFRLEELLQAVRRAVASQR